MSSHVGEATASPSPPEGLDKRQERYWLIERRCKDLCLYLDVLTRNMPRHEKYVLSAKMRELGMELNSKSGVGWVDDGVDWVGYRHWRTYKLIRKRSLKRLKRKANGCSLETAMAYLSHAKDTASLRHVARLLWRGNPEHRPEIYSWLRDWKGDLRSVICT